MILTESIHLPISQMFNSKFTTILTFGTSIGLVYSTAIESKQINTSLLCVGYILGCMTGLIFTQAVKRQLRGPINIGLMLITGWSLCRYIRNHRNKCIVH